MTKLLPCPFCGSPAVKSSFERGISSPLETITQIQCCNDDGCKVCVDTQHVNEAVAIEAWNTRAAILPQQMREALESARDYIASVNFYAAGTPAYIKNCDQLIKIDAALAHTRPECG